MTLSTKLSEAFNAQVNAEMWSANLYLSMAVYFKKEALNGFASWMEKQAEEELDHARKMINFAIERGGDVTIGQVNVVPTAWGSPVEVFEHVYNHEKHVSELIDNMLNIAEEDKDHAARAFLFDFVREQVEEEATAQGIVDKIKKAGDTGIFFVDSQLGQR